MNKRVAAWGWMAGAAVLTLKGPVWADDAEELYHQMPGKIERLFSELDLSRPPLAPLRPWVEKRDYPEACRKLLEVYRHIGASSRTNLQLPPPDGKTVENLLENRFCFQGVTAEISCSGDGHWDWSFEAPNHDKEWTAFLNRHGYLLDLLSAYQANPRPALARRMGEILKDWIRSNPYPGQAMDSPQWRAVESARRIADVWPQVFYGMINSPDFTDQARLLMFCSVPEHADNGLRFHAPGGNHLLTEMLGLATAAMAWPEFKEAPHWLEYARRTVEHEMKRQFYPEGSQKELSNHYQKVTLLDLERFAGLFHHDRQSLPEGFQEQLDRMWNYFYEVMKPNGWGPLNNDADLENNLQALSASLSASHHPEWRQPPAFSAWFPWAGQDVLRSRNEGRPLWLFFNRGPAGIAHQHRDKLHISAWVGRDLLVDAGRYTYHPGPWRWYFTSSESHNVILVDGQSQRFDCFENTAPLRQSPLRTKDLEFVWGTQESGFLGGGEKVRHRRAVLSLLGNESRNAGWVVIDQILTFERHQIEALWHFHPDCSVSLKGNMVQTTDPGVGNLMILPIGNMPWKPRLIRGQTEPFIQGWWSPFYNMKKESSVVDYEAILHAPAVFAWLLWPSFGPCKGTEIKATFLSPHLLQLEAPSAKNSIPLTIEVDMRPDQPEVQVNGVKIKA